jgi:hypothetical protein
MQGSEAPGSAAPPDDEAITAIESALHSLARRLRQMKLHQELTRQAGVDIDQAGLAVLYVLSDEDCSLRVTEVAARLAIDTPAVTRKAQQLERLGLVGRAKDTDDARATDGSPPRWPTGPPPNNGNWPGSSAVSPTTSISRPASATRRGLPQRTPSARRIGAPPSMTVLTRQS